MASDIIGWWFSESAYSLDSIFDIVTFRVLWFAVYMSTCNKMGEGLFPRHNDIVTVSK